MRGRESLCGCIVGLDIAVLSLVIVTQGEAGVCTFSFTFLLILTRNQKPLADPPHAPRSKRTTNMLNLSKEDGVCKYVIRREVKSVKENAKPYTRVLKIQRLLTLIVSSAVAISFPSSAENWSTRRSRSLNTSECYISTSTFSLANRLFSALKASHRQPRL